MLMFDDFERYFIAARFSFHTRCPKDTYKL